MLTDAFVQANNSEYRIDLPLTCIDNIILTQQQNYLSSYMYLWAFMYLKYISIVVWKHFSQKQTQKQKLCDSLLEA